jgi:hypothetical protein
MIAVPASSREKRIMPHSDRVGMGSARVPVTLTPATGGSFSGYFRPPKQCLIFSGFSFIYG